MAVVPTKPLSEDRAEREKQVLDCLRKYVGKACFFDYEGRETRNRLTGMIDARDGVIGTPPNDAYVIMGLDEAAKKVDVRNTATGAEVRVPFFKVTEISQIVVP